MMEETFKLFFSREYSARNKERTRNQKRKYQESDN